MAQVELAFAIDDIDGARSFGLGAVRLGRE